MPKKKQIKTGIEILKTFRHYLPPKLEKTLNGFLEKNSKVMSLLKCEKYLALPQHIRIQYKSTGRLINGNTYYRKIKSKSSKYQIKKLWI